MSFENDDSALPIRAVLRAQDVVAAGRVNNILQVPSPIYTAEFTDAHHVLIGAGGGGRKFGMVNIALLLRVNSLRGSQSKCNVASSAASNGVEASASPSPRSSSTLPPTGPSLSEPSVWGFASAIDLGADIPWCTSTFLPFDVASAGGSTTDPATLSWSEKQHRVLQGLVGFLALSSIASFTLIGVYEGAEPTTSISTAVAAESSSTNAADKDTQKTSVGEGRYLRQLARITVPHDGKNPDKKPVALSQNLLLVAHDSNGVFGYALTDLVPDGFEDEDAEDYCTRYASQLKADCALQSRVPRVVTAANHVLEWQLPARVNDLSVNRVCIVQADKAVALSATALLPSADAAQPCKAHLHEHLVVAAVLQNKTVAMSSLHLRRKYGVRARDALKRQRQGEKVAESAVVIASRLQTTLTLTGSRLPLPFKLLTSSLRLVRLFGWNNIDATQQATMRRQLTWQSLQEGGTPTHGPLCSVLLVAFNTHTNESFIIHGAVNVTAPAELENNNISNINSSSELTLSVQWVQPKPTPVLGDAITSLSICADRVPADYEAQVRRSPVGAAVPPHLLAGTVEGWVASVRWDFTERRWRTDHVRPSPSKSVAKRFPALHHEPVSCVAVSAENDVVSADIAQNIALTSMPYASCSSSATSASSPPKNGVCGGGRQANEELKYVVQPRLAAASALFPTSRSDRGLIGWLMEEAAGESLLMRALVFLVVPLLVLLVASALILP